MQNNPSQQNFIFSTLILARLRPITGDFSSALFVRTLSSKKVWGKPVGFLYVAVILGSLSNLSALKAEFSVSSLAYQKNNFLVSSKETQVNRLNGSPQSRVRAQPSNYSLAQPSVHHTRQSEAKPLEAKSLEVKSPSFFEKRAEGWHWYESLSDGKTEEKKQKNDSTVSPQTPTERIEDQRKELEAKLHSAILEPNSENIIAYILAQKAIMDQSERFSEAWKRIVMTTPSLDETLVYPVDQNARTIYDTEQGKELQKRIRRLSQDYGLFFFFKKECSFCHHFAPIVKRFSQKYGWSVLAISLDGGVLPEFPNARQDNGIAKRLQIQHIPALVALHPTTQQLIPLAYGLISETHRSSHPLLRAFV